MRARVLAVAGLLALSTLASVPAVAAAPSDTASVAPKPARDVVAEGLGSGTQNLRIKAHVKGQPIYANKITILQSKECKTCTWRPARKKRTGTSAYVVYPVNAPATGRRFFRVKVPATVRYRASYSNVLVASRS